MDLTAFQRTLPQALRHQATHQPDRTAIRQKRFGIWKPISWASYYQRASHVGLGLAALGEISFKDGKVQQDNFHQYELARMPLAPKAVSVHLLEPDGDLPLGGVGEPGVPPIAPALCNAIFAATGQRVRQLPVQLERS